jgi:hypothetical protein
MAVILEFHQGGVGHNDMALEQSNLPCTWPDVWRGYTHYLDWDHLFLCPDSGPLYDGKIQISSKVSYRIFNMMIMATHLIFQYSAQSTCVV